MSAGRRIQRDYHVNPPGPEGRAWPQAGFGKRRSNDRNQMRLERSDLELEVVVRRIQEGELDLQPDFQRGEVWNVERKQRLVDTILRQWYVPAVYVITEEETSREVVLDGQQRLASVRDFFADRIPVDGSAPPFDAEIARLGGLRYSELPPETQRRVRRFPLTVVSLYSYQPEEPYELFFRLNQHLPLTPSEKRNALYGPAQQQVKHLVGALTEAGLLTREVVGFSNGRLAYDDIIARFLLAAQWQTLRRPVSNAAIEAFYRTERFDDDVLRLGLESARLFLEPARDAPVRFNKATLFSWLTFTYTRLRLGADGPDSTFISAFEAARQAIRKANEHDEPSSWSRDSLRIYNDRASYRVADTQSVLLRDVVLHLHAYAASPAHHPYLAQLEPLLHDAGRGLQHQLIEFVDFSGWGELP